MPQAETMINCESSSYCKLSIINTEMKAAEQTPNSSQIKSGIKTSGLNYLLKNLLSKFWEAMSDKEEPESWNLKINK